MTKKHQSILFYTISYLFVLLLVVYTLYPIIYTLLGSVKTNAELTQGGAFLPENWHFENYKNALLQGNFLQYGMNSLIVSLSVLIIAVITTSLAGYTFARKTFYGKKLIMTLYLALVFIAMGSVTLFPTYRILLFLHLNRSLAGLILALVGGQITNVLLVMGFVKTIPIELDEAATIDGCSPYGTFFRVILPLLKPILAVVALFSFRTAWNNYLISFIISIFTPSIKTLTVAVVQLKYSVNAAAEWHIMLAGASLSIIPILILYVFANKQFIGGLTAGAVKG
jgi:ABC-type glycerol-3-phosphate transport system permease component